MDLFSQVLDKLKDGTTITFTKDNIAYGDRFLILTDYRPSITCTFKWHELVYVFFDCDEPMLLEDCPDSFLESILLNL